MKLTMQKHKDGFYIGNEKTCVNVPKRFMRKDPFGETVRFLHLLGFELEIRNEEGK